jgi:ATP-binding cassette subfamily C (CFTR/MRP) protein 1
LRLEVIGGIIVFGTAILSVLRRDTLGPGIVGNVIFPLTCDDTLGLSLSYALMMTGIINGLARAFVDFEIRMNNIERISHYIAIKPEEDSSLISLIEDSEEVKENRWPTKGSIDIISLEARYKADQDPVLKNVSISIKSAEKVGIVGRTGKKTVLTYFNFSRGWKKFFGFGSL